MSAVGFVVHSHSLLYNQYADDLMLYTALVPSLNNDLAFIERCDSAVSSWFLKNALLLNPDKTEADIFGTRQRLAGFNSSPGIDIASSNVSFNDSLNLLGVTLATLSFDKRVERCSQLHVSYKSSASHPAIAYCRGSQDCCCCNRRNSLLYGSTDRNLNCLQRAQNTLACVVLQAPRSASTLVCGRSCTGFPSGSGSSLKWPQSLSKRKTSVNPTSRSRLGLGPLHLGSRVGLT